jgi:hypothetical protein
MLAELATQPLVEKAFTYHKMAGVLEMILTIT